MSDVVSQYFNETLAGLFLNPLTNSPENGFSLAVSASFAETPIEAKVIDENGNIQFSLECEAAIYECNIDFETINSNVIITPNRDRSEPVIETYASKKKQSSYVSVRSIDLNTNSAAGAKQLTGGFGASAAAAKQKITIETSTHTENVQHTERMYRYHSPQTVVVGRYMTQEKDKNRILSGTIIDDREMLRVRPKDPTKEYGVLVRLICKRGRMRFENIKIQNFERSSLANSIFEKIRRFRDKNETAFKILIMHLVQRSLQSRHSVDNEACLAFAGVIYGGGSSYDNDAYVAVLPENTDSNICIDFAPINRLIESNPSELREILRIEGVPDDEISSINRSEAEKIPTQIGVRNSKEVIRVSANMAWSSVCSVAMNRIEITDWSSTVESIFGIKSPSPEESYLRSLCAFPIIPNVEWERMCLYLDYRYDDIDDLELARKLGRRLFFADSLSMENLGNMQTLTSIGDGELDYTSGSWLVGSLGIWNLNLNSEESTSYQLAVSLDNARIVAELLDEKKIQLEILKILECKDILFESKLICLAVLFESGRFYEIVRDALIYANSSIAPSLQVGLLNGLPSGMLTLEARGLRNDLVARAAELCYGWLDAMAPVYGRTMVPFLDFSEAVAQSARREAGAGGS